MSDFSLKDCADIVVGVLTVPHEYAVPLTRFGYVNGYIGERGAMEEFQLWRDGSECIHLNKMKPEDLCTVPGFALRPTDANLGEFAARVAEHLDEWTADEAPEGRFTYDDLLEKTDELSNANEREHVHPRTPSWVLTEDQAAEIAALISENLYFNIDLAASLIVGAMGRDPGFEFNGVRLRVVAREFDERMSQPCE
jgi:hypothetical protein